MASQQKYRGMKMNDTLNWDCIAEIADFVYAERSVGYPKEDKPFDEVVDEIFLRRDEISDEILLRWPTATFAEISHAVNYIYWPEWLLLIKKLRAMDRLENKSDYEWLDRRKWPFINR
jgi:hypothetical protein